MIQITPHMRIFLATEAVDFRKGIDGLGGICRQVLKEDPFSGSMFIFRNRRGTALKILLYDGQGFWLFCKRLSKGKFAWWPKKVSDGDGDGVLSVTPAQLHILLWNGDPSCANLGKDWRRIN
ncbi:MAG: IS66 family insertion sequence element accessory protein TnpB [bacterium]|nr:IS66 family insertion sequence element accessory protein TnpB [bacterium]